MTVSDIFVALGDPSRRQIVAFLAEGEAPAGEIVDQFAVSAPAISQHLRALRKAGLVSVRADAQRRIYSLNRQALGEAAAWLMRNGGFWSQRMAALEDELKAP